MATAVHTTSGRVPIRFSPGLAALVLMAALWAAVAMYAGSPFPLRLVTDASMEPTFRRGDVVLVRSASFSDIAKGDVVAFELADPPEDGPPVRMFRRVVDIGVLGGDLALATMKGDGLVDQSVVRPEQVEGVAVLRIKAIGWPLVVFGDNQNAAFISLGTLLGLLLVSTLVVFYRSVPRKREPAASRPAPPLIHHDEGDENERDELRETIIRLSEKIEEIEARQTGELSNPQHVETSQPPAPVGERAPLAPPGESPRARDITIDPTPISDLLREPAPPTPGEAAQPHERELPEEVEPPQEPPETQTRAPRPARGQQAFITLSEQELTELDLESPETPAETDSEPLPTHGVFTESDVDIDLEPPTVQLFDEYRRAADVSDERTPPRIDEISDDELDRFVSRIIDVEMPVHIALLREEAAEHYRVREEDDASFQRRLDGVIESLVSQERAAWERADGSRAARGQFLNNPVFASGISARRPRQNERPRDIRRMAISELQAGVSSVMWAMYTASRDVLIAETARQFGYERLDGAVYDRIALAIDRMVQGGRLLDQSGGLTLRD